MNGTKKIKSLLLATAIVMAPMAIAQEKGHGKQKDPAERAEARTSRMTEELGLNADQAEKVKEINMQHMQRMHELREQELEKDERIKLTKEARDQHRDRLKAVLSAEQYTRLEELKKQRREEHRARKEKDRPEDQD